MDGAIHARLPSQRRASKKERVEMRDGFGFLAASWEMCLHVIQNYPSISSHSQLLFRLSECEGQRDLFLSKDFTSRLNECIQSVIL